MSRASGSTNKKGSTFTEAQEDLRVLPVNTTIVSSLNEFLAALGALLKVTIQLLSQIETQILKSTSLVKCGPRFHYKGKAAIHLWSAPALDGTQKLSIVCATGTYSLKWTYFVIGFILTLIRIYRWKGSASNSSNAKRGPHSTSPDLRRSVRGSATSSHS